MEETLDTINSCSLIRAAKICCKVVENIKVKHLDRSKYSEELRFLKKHFLSQDVAISNIAGTALLTLVEDRILPLDETLAEVISYINTTRTYPSLTNVLGELLYLGYKPKYRTRIVEFEELLEEENENEFDEDESRKKYNLSSPQHPFITLLIQHPDCWNLILLKIEELQSRNRRFFKHALFKPFYLYVIFSPTQYSGALLKYRLWQFFSSNNMEVTMFYWLLSWLKIQNTDSLQLASDIVTYALGDPKYSNYSNLFLLLQTSILYEVVNNRMDIKSTFSSLKEASSKKRHFMTDNCMILIFSKIIINCSPVDFEDICMLCESIIKKGNIEPYILDTIRASVLLWLANPCSLIPNSYTPANFILNESDGYKCTTSNKDGVWKKFSRNQFKSNNNMMLASELFSLSQNLKNEIHMVRWLDDLLGNCATLFLVEIFHFLCGLFLNTELHPRISLRLLSVVLKCVDYDIQLAPRALVLILYKLNNCSNTQMKFELLRALPKMVAHKENLPKALAALEALSKDNDDLFNMCLSLMYEAWTINNKCYPYLEKMLVNTDVTKKWESYVAKVFVIKQLCKEKPHLHGKEMVAHLSKILNECEDDEGSVPSAIAIEAITLLCRAEVIDIETTWKNLMLKYETDSRGPVIKSLCLLVKEIPRLSYTETNEDLYEGVLKKMWDYAESDNPEISDAALDALTAFSLHQISPHIPTRYVDENPTIKIVPATLVSGKTWINLLKAKGFAESPTNFIVKLVSNEIDAYLKHVYQTKGVNEPLNCSHLPLYSVLRAVMEFTRTLINKFADQDQTTDTSAGPIDCLVIRYDLSLKQCLHILSREYNKPLPPYNWSFLKEAMTNSSYVPYCLNIAAHQVHMSATARELLENFIQNVTPTIQGSDITEIYRIMKYLANSIQPSILKPLLVNSINKAIEYFQNKGIEVAMIDTVFDSLRTILGDPDIQATNKTTIVEVLRDVMFITDVENELFTPMMRVFMNAPKDCVQKITNISPRCDEKWLGKIIKLKCVLAGHPDASPPDINREIMNLIHQTDSVGPYWLEFQKVLESQLHNPNSCLWLVELAGNVQKLAAKRIKDETQMCLELSLMIWAVVYFSGYHCFVECEQKDAHIKDLFPQALVVLLTHESWDCSISDFLEWLYYMNSAEHIPAEYRQLFGLSLKALRHTSEFMSDQAWMKYLNCNTDICLS